MFNLLDLNKNQELREDELSALAFALSEIPELGRILEKLSPVTKEDVEDVTDKGYIVPTEVIDALGVDYFDELVEETKNAIGSTVTQSSDVPVQKQGEKKTEE